ncbi:hypothetical protein AURDEDRAFT_137352 [Auricularia subglabra TFB-10046 SS5]|nr:hypothetical protein AURDEDRAFT_137352 [Auricularia subglabra TFB-10046 SS5]
MTHTSPDTAIQGSGGHARIRRHPWSSATIGSLAIPTLAENAAPTPGIHCQGQLHYFQSCMVILTSFPRDHRGSYCPAYLICGGWNFQARIPTRNTSARGRGPVQFTAFGMVSSIPPAAEPMADPHMAHLLLSSGIFYTV